MVGTFTSGVKHPMDNADGLCLQVSSKASASLLQPFITVKHIHTLLFFFASFLQVIGFISATDFLFALVMRACF